MGIGLDIKVRLGAHFIILGIDISNNSLLVELVHPTALWGWKSLQGASSMLVGNSISKINWWFNTEIIAKL